MWFWNVWNVFEFEFRRTFTWRRLLIAVALAMFPVLMILLVQSQGARLERGDRGELCLFFLIPGVLCVLGLLLWATGVVHSELEERTWTYLVTRPVGRGAILIGKYLSAVAWTMICALTSLALSVAVLVAYGDALTSAPALAVLAMISSMAYGAVFVFLSVLIPSRAMVAAVAYIGAMESVVAWLPAAINRFSILYHLRCLFAHWLLETQGSHGSDFDSLFFGDMPAWQHVALLLGITVGLLCTATIVLRRRQMVVSTDV